MRHRQALFARRQYRRDQRRKHNERRGVYTCAGCGCEFAKGAGVADKKNGVAFCSICLQASEAANHAPCGCDPADGTTWGRFGRE